MPTSSNNSDSQKTSGNPAFTSPPSTRALGLIAIAILIAFLLVLIVDSDNSSKETKSKNGATSTTTTIPNNSDTNSDDNSTTETTKAISGTKNPAEVSVLVLNGSSIGGVAGSVTTSIGDLDYKILTAGNSNAKASGTIVYYKSGFQKDAEHLAANVVPGLLANLKISQDVTVKTFPSSAPIAWDQENLVAANIVILIGNP